MKALTICQPWVWAIIHANKRVENRTWYTDYRGPLLIHAGKSRSWMNPPTLRQLEPFGIRRYELPFGAIVGVCSLVAVLDGVGRMRQGNFNGLDLGDPRFIEGPQCFVLANVRSLTPIPWRGAQGLFDVPDDVLPSEVCRG